MTQSFSEGIPKNLNFSEWTWGVELLESLDEHAIVAITDKSGKITYANDQFCEISGYSRDELLGKNHRILKSGLHPPEFYAEMWQTITRGKTWKGVICNRKKTGELYWVATTIRPILGKDGKPSCYLAIRTDITAVKERENLFAKLNQNRRLLLAQIGHELRNPLNSILGLSDLAIKEDSLANIREYLGLIRSTGFLTLELLNNLIEQARWEEGKWQLIEESFCIQEEIEKLVEPFKILAKKKGIQITIRSTINRVEKFLGDISRIRQIMLNLLSNALKFTEKGIILIKLQEEAGKLIFSVIDSGVGIAKEKLKDIFHLFNNHSFDMKNAIHTSSGLGLFITKKIVEFLNGQMEVFSPPREFSSGSEFVVSLPIKKLGKKEKTKYSFHNSETVFKRDIKILVIEDDPISSYYLQRILEDTPYSVLLAKNLTEARNLLKNHKPEILLTDFYLPDGPITTLSQEIQQYRLLICIMTGLSPAELEPVAGEFPYHAVLQKPFTTQEIKNTLAELVYRLWYRDDYALYRTKFLGKGANKESTF